MSDETVIQNGDGDAHDMPLANESDLVLGSLGASIDPLAGGTLKGKPILSAEQIAAWLNRTGGGYADGYNDTPNVGQQNNIGDDNHVITFGFFSSQDQLWDNGYVYEDGGQLFGLAEFFNFAPFTDAQKAAAREAIQAWDDVASVSFREVSADDADINFGNLASAPATQAYSRIPTVGLDGLIGGQVREIGGDVWISASQASNFRLDEGQYGIHTLVHEIGHSLGLSHPGAYNAAPGLSITYAVNAEYAQDTRAYTVMSYFEASSISGDRHFDFNISTTVYSATPLIHDIAAIQRIYGADMTTRTGDTIYGFNSNAGRDSYDFTKTPAPIMAIWDAGGNDTIDASGYATDQIIDLTPGSMSSIGGVTYDTAPSFAQVNANRAAAGLPPISETTYNANMAVLLVNPAVGRLTDNVGIAYGSIIENAIGGSGNDSLIGNSVDNVLKGNAGNDIIGAGAGNDTLDGGLGNDEMLGGIGDDLFIVDSAGDIVTEHAGEGLDTVSSSISYTLGADVENLILTGGAVAGTGNDLDNVLTGNALGNSLSGGAGNDRLIGGAGNDTLDGGVGNDEMLGGIGDDLFIVDSAGDVVTEHAGEGVDTVSSSISYTLGADVENLVLTGRAVAGTGNDLDNVLTGDALGNRLSGGAGNDRLIGGDGIDFMTGGSGSDVFVGEFNSTRLSSKIGQVSLDVITDFKSGTDKIDLSAIDAISGLGGDQAFTFAGMSANKNAGELTYKIYDSVNGAENALGIDLDGIDGPSTYTGPVTIVFANIDGGTPDLAIALFNTNGVTSADFLL